MQREKRQIIYVCSAISSSGELISEMVPASTTDEAGKIFFNKKSLKPQTVFGPFYKKRTILNKIDTVNLKFSNETRKAIFNDWNVTAFLLNDPKDHAFLVFNKHVYNKNITIPTGTTIVSIYDLRFI